MSTPNDNGADGVEHVKAPTLLIVLDPHTLIVSMKCDDVAISVAQMMVEEVRLQLDIQRRQAATLELAQKVHDAQRTAEILANMRGKG